ncbi:MAG: hypothetical protein H6834_01080 [Planctomycetes bacterium]|nr:hypothetical protein [Planctomycetota bacterium]
MEVHPRSGAPRARVVGVRSDSGPARVSTRSDGVVAVLVLGIVGTLLWGGSCSGWLRFDVGGHAEGAQFLDRTVDELRSLPFEDLARKEASHQIDDDYRVEYSVRRKRHDMLEIQASLVDRRGGTTIDRLVTWRSRGEESAAIPR